MKLLQFLPSLLMLLGVSLWSFTIFFDSPTNRHEAKLKDYQLLQMERSIPIFEKDQKLTYVLLQSAIRNSPDDTFIFQAIDRILKGQKSILNDFEKEEIGKKEIQSKIVIYKNDILNHLKTVYKKIPYYEKNEVEETLEILAIPEFIPIKWSKRTFKTLSKYEVYAFTTKVINRLAKSSSTIIECSFGSSFMFDKMEAKVNEATSINIICNTYGNRRSMFLPSHAKQITINSELYPALYGVAVMEVIPNNTTPLKYHLEYDLLLPSFNNYETIFDTIKETTQITVYPIQ